MDDHDRARRCPQLLPGRRRQVALATGLTAAASVAVLAGYTHGARRTWVDGFVDTRVVPWLEPLSPLLGYATSVAGPVKIAAAAALLAGLCFLLGDGRGGLLALGAPVIALVLTEVVLKPWIARPPDVGLGLAFPSGHATASVALGATALVVARPGGALAAALPAGLGVLWRALAWTVPVYLAAALMLFRHHYVTDILGGAAVAAAVVCGLALCLDMVPMGRLSRMTSGPRPEVRPR